jgi:hypothetical protein
MTLERENAWVPKEKPRLKDTYPPAKSDQSITIPFEKILDWLLDEDNRSRLEDHLDWYLRHYDGRFFEYFIQHSDQSRFTSWDILAVEALSVSVPTKAVKWLVEPDQVRDNLMDEVWAALGSGNKTLWSCAESLLLTNNSTLNESGALSQLYTCLRKQKIGPVTTSKLLAAKFPKVVPIKDSRIVALLELDPKDDLWLMFRKLFNDGEISLEKYLNQLVVPDECGELTSLRRLDIILWMESNARNIQIMTRK